MGIQLHPYLPNQGDGVKTRWGGRGRHHAAAKVAPRGSEGAGEGVR